MITQQTAWHEHTLLISQIKPQTYDVGGRQCSESMRSHGNTSAGSGYSSCALPDRYLFINRVVEWLKPSLALTLRCLVRQRWTVVRTCITFEPCQRAPVKVNQTLACPPGLAVMCMLRQLRREDPSRYAGASLNCAHLTSQDLSELHSPLVEGVDAPDEALPSVRAPEITSRNQDTQLSSIAGMSRSCRVHAARTTLCRCALRPCRTHR